MCCLLLRKRAEKETLKRLRKRCEIKFSEALKWMIEGSRKEITYRRRGTPLLCPVQSELAINGI